MFPQVPTSHPWITVRRRHLTHSASIALRNSGCRIVGWAAEALRQMPTAGACPQVSFSAPSVAELGLPDGGSFEEVLANAKEAGLALCRGEDVIGLRLAYLEQADGERLPLAMSPITIEGFGPAIFVLARCDGVLEVADTDAHPTSFYGPDRRIIFAVS